MSTSFDNRSNTSTTAFTLPSNASSSLQQQTQTQRPTGTGTGTTEDSYEEFPSQQPQSPSLPWLVEYWGSSFLRTPAMIIDQMFSCTSCNNTSSSLDEVSVHHSHDNDRHRNNGNGSSSSSSSPTTTTMPLDESYRIDDNKNCLLYTSTSPRDSR